MGVPVRTGQKLRLRASGEPGRLITFDRDVDWRNGRPWQRDRVIVELDRDGRRVIVNLELVEFDYQKEEADGG